MCDPVIYFTCPVCEKLNSPFSNDGDFDLPITLFCDFCDSLLEARVVVLKEGKRK